MAPFSEGDAHSDAADIPGGEHAGISTGEAAREFTKDAWGGSMSGMSNAAGTPAKERCCCDQHLTSTRGKFTKGCMERVNERGEQRRRYACEGEGQ
jgi:hypothetical protein